MIFYRKWSWMMETPARTQRRQRKGRKIQMRVTRFHPTHPPQVRVPRRRIRNLTPPAPPPHRRLHHQKHLVPTVARAGRWRRGEMLDKKQKKTPQVPARTQHRRGNDKVSSVGFSGIVTCHWYQHVLPLLWIRVQKLTWVFFKFQTKKSLQVQVAFTRQTPRSKQGTA